MQMHEAKGRLPIGGSWLGCLLWAGAGFVASQLTMPYAIVCFTPAVVFVGLWFAALGRKLPWNAPISFLIGLGLAYAIAFYQLSQVLRHLD
jgi:hypothetical protein